MRAADAAPDRAPMPMPRFPFPVVLPLALLAFAAAPIASADVPAASRATAWQQEMLEEVNAIRTSRGLGRLRLCRPLGVAAQRYAGTMLRTSIVSHTGPNGSSAGGRIRASGYTYRVHGENIARGPATVAVVVRAWFASPGHRRNLLYPSFRHVGFGHAVGDPSIGEIYWSQSFGAGGRCD